MSSTTSNYSNDPVVVLAAARTPLGAFQGQLAGATAPQLGAVAIQAAVERSGLPADQVQEVLMGCVLPAGVGQAPARQAALAAGLPLSAGCTTVSKVCGSGMKAVMLAQDLLRAGSVDVVVAGGMESMSNAPYLLPKARSGYRLGHGALTDHMFFDGLEDRYGEQTQGRLMGSFADDCARHYAFTRQQQDEFAARSTLLARDAQRSGYFDWELAPVEVASRAGLQTVREDEQPPKLDLSRIASLKPAFGPDGTVTAANASSIADGAAALVLTRMSVADQRGIAPLALLRGHATHAREPAWFTTAPVGAARALLARVGWAVEDVDLWEINEAFAVVPMVAMEELKLEADRVNVHGGACALGHPIGATGARILVSLIGALRLRRLKRGVAVLCIGGGEATAVAVEMC